MSTIMNDVNEWFKSVRDDRVERSGMEISTPHIDTCVFIDLDNTSYDELDSFKGVKKNTEIRFYADEVHISMTGNKAITNPLKNIGITPVITEAKSGKNSVDFLIVADMATMLASYKYKQIYLISKDRGYDSVLKRFQALYGKNMNAIERYSTVRDFILDVNIMRSKSIKELKDHLVKAHFQNCNQDDSFYRQHVIDRLIDL